MTCIKHPDHGMGTRSINTINMHFMLSMPLLPQHGPIRNDLFLFFRASPVDVVALSRSLLECSVCNETQSSVDLDFSPKKKRKAASKRSSDFFSSARLAVASHLMRSLRVHSKENLFVQPFVRSRNLWFAVRSIVSETFFASSSSASPEKRDDNSAKAINLR